MMLIVAARDKRPNARSAALMLPNANMSFSFTTLSSSNSLSPVVGMNVGLERSALNYTLVQETLPNV